VFINRENEEGKITSRPCPTMWELTLTHNLATDLCFIRITALYGKY